MPRANEVIATVPEKSILLKWLPFEFWEEEKKTEKIEDLKKINSPRLQIIPRLYAVEDSFTSNILTFDRGLFCIVESAPLGSAPCFRL